ncbi:MAG: Ig-like domain-containing protein, partial [Actinomycetia bacterium]|nr:Ig-like domain-containing protein [Actinomycetes bacterium]
GGSATASVDVTMRAVDDAPVAIDNAYFVFANSSINVPVDGVLGNDSDAEGDALSATLVSPQSHGTLSFNSDGSFSYAPDAGFEGLDSFTYQALAGGLNSNTATVILSVTSPNSLLLSWRDDDMLRELFAPLPPEAIDDSANTFENTPVTIDVLVNDNDWYPDTLVVRELTQPAHGTVAIESDGTVTYTPDPGFRGVDSFTYRAYDGYSDSNVADVVIQVSAVDDELSITSISVTPTPSINEGQVADLTVEFTDPGGIDTHLATVTWGDGTSEEIPVTPSSPSGPSPDTGGVAGSVLGSHIYADDGEYTITVTITDDGGATATGALIVTVQNVAPTLDPGPDQVSAEGTEIALAPASFNDLGTLDTHTATVNWGDGSETETGIVTETPFGPPGSAAGADGTITGTHTYATTGIYQAAITVSDDDGGQISEIVTVYVTGIGLHDGLLQIVGSRGNDIVTITPSGQDQIFVNVTCEPLGNTRRYFNLADITSIGVDTRDGNDRVMVSERLRILTMLRGGSGNDILQGGGGRNLILGEEGDDSISGGGGRDFLIGGPGADQLLGSDGEDALVSGTLDNGHAQLRDLWDAWGSDEPYETRAKALMEQFKFRQDEQRDELFGGAGPDVFIASATDSPMDVTPDEIYFVPPAKPTPHTNPVEACDVNNDRLVTPLDAILVISDLNRQGARRLDSAASQLGALPMYLDASGDNIVSAVDALLVINFLNAVAAELADFPGAEGELSHLYQGGLSSSEIDRVYRESPWMEASSVGMPGYAKTGVDARQGLPRRDARTDRSDDNRFLNRPSENNAFRDASDWWDESWPSIEEREQALSMIAREIQRDWLLETKLAALPGIWAD